MSEDMPWVIGLTDEEVQELRSKKQELTQYGKEKIKKLMNDGKLRFYDKGKEVLTIDDSSWGKTQTPETQLHIKEMTHEEMLEIAAEREAINKKALEELGIDYENFGQKPWSEGDLNYVTPNGDYIKSYPLINRVEVIGKNGREYVNMECSHVQVSEQDNGRTLKVFLS